MTDLITRLSKLDAPDREEQAVLDAYERAKSAPLCKIYQDHKGRKFIGEHTNAWAQHSDELMRAIALLRAKEASKL